ncbi:MAG: hypothetical protein KC917_13680, partial [Candidatus Omnitrophica bacterium]|nr:hypothetical protein [Candidatus Omnitrophota bacterium]
MAATNLPTGALGTVGPSGRSHEPEALSLPTGERQLFLDDHLIAKTEDLKRTLHQPDKKGAVI